MRRVVTIVKFVARAGECIMGNYRAMGGVESGKQAGEESRESYMHPFPEFRKSQAE